MCITAQEYDAMIKDARVGSILGRSIAFNQENKTVDVSNDGFSIMKFTVSCTNVVTIDTEQLRKSLFKDDADVRFIVKGNKGKISFEG